MYQFDYKSYQHILLMATLYLLGAQHSYGQTPWCKPYEVFNRYVPAKSDDFFVLQIECKKGVIKLDTSWQSAPATSIKSDKKQPFKFAIEYKNGVRAEINVREERLVNMGHDVADVQLFRGTSPLLHFSSSGNLFYSIQDHSCWSRYHDGGMADGIIRVIFPPNLAAKVAEILQRNNWEADAGNEVFARLNAKSCPTGKCATAVDVGSGNNFVATSELNAIGSGTCAEIVGLPAGGPPLLVAGIPVQTFADPASAGTRGIADLLKAKVLEKIFSAHVMIGDVHVAGRGKVFSVSILGPNQELHVTMKPGYWYKGDLSLRVGLTVHEGELCETLEITVLDLFEIRAPEDIPRLPTGILESGRELKYLNSKTGDRSPDGKTIDDWTAILATKSSDAIGGYVSQ